MKPVSEKLLWELHGEGVWVVGCSYYQRVEINLQIHLSVYGHR